jgi:hypothetical protein
VIDDDGGSFQEDWSWVAPLMAAILSPLLASGVSIAWDYVKLKGWVK